MVARALVDSGADVSLMPLEWVQRLRFAQEHAVEQLVETASGAGTVATYDDVVRLTIARTRRSVNVGAVFADVPFMLLGRADFFRAFRVLFDERGRTVTLTEYDAVAA